MNHFEESLLHFVDESTDLKRYLNRQVEVFADRIAPQHEAEQTTQPARILHVGAQSPTLLLGLAELGHAVFAEAGQTRFDKLPSAIAARLQQTVTWLAPLSAAAGVAATTGPAAATGPAATNGIDAPFDVIIAANNTLADCLTEGELQATIGKLGDRLAPGGMLLANVRNYDLLLQTRSRTDGLQIFSTARGHCIYFATLEWEGQECAYTANRYLIAQTNGSIAVDHTTTTHRAWRFAEINMALLRAGFSDIQRRPLDDDRMLLCACAATG